MTPSIRLHVATPLHEGAEIALSAGQAHYLGTVMRRPVGGEVLLFNGRDGEWRGRIAALRRDRGHIEVGARVRGQIMEPDIWLVFAVLKRDATELVVEKATELGVSRLLPVVTARTIASRVNLDRLGLIAIEAAEQCERLSVPAIAPPTDMAAMLAHWPAERRLVVAAERASGGAVPRGGASAALLVGPEGGFTPGELDLLARQPFVQMASLGPRILRAETAAIVGLALLQVRHDGQD